MYIYIYVRVYIYIYILHLTIVPLPILSNDPPTCINLFPRYNFLLNIHVSPSPFWDSLSLTGASVWPWAWNCPPEPGELFNGFTIKDNVCDSLRIHQ